MRGNTTRTDSGEGGSSGSDPYRLARVLVFDVYEKTRRASADRAPTPRVSAAELRRAAVSTANSLLTFARFDLGQSAARLPQRRVSERHRRAALEGLEHLSHWLDACVEEGSLTTDEQRELDGLRLGLVEALALKAAND